MPRSRRAWILNLVGIASLFAALYVGEQLGGLWMYTFPVYLLILLALTLLWRRRTLRGERNDSRSGGRLT